MAQQQVSSSVERTVQANKPAEREIRKILAKYESAVNRADAPTLISLFAPQAIFYDLTIPFQYKGIEALKERLTAWLSGYQKGIDFKFDELSVFASDDVVSACGLVRSSGTKTDGATSSMWFRATLVFQKHGDEWLIVHEHSSEPFDMKTGKAVFQRDEAH